MPLGALLNGVFGFMQNQSNIRAQREAQNDANEFARQQMLEAHYLNSLPSQVREALDAGMNPNLINGSSFTPVSQVGNQPTANFQQPNPVQFGSDSFMDVVQKNATNKLLKAQAITENELRDGRVRQQNADYNFTLQQTALSKQQVRNLGIEFDQITESINQIRAQTQNFLESAEVARWQGRNLRQQYEWTPRLNKSQLDNIIAQTATTYQQKEFLKSQGAYFYELMTGQSLANNVYRKSQNWLIGQNRRNFQMLGRQLKILDRNVSILPTQDGMIKFQLGQYKTYDDFHQTLSILNSGCNFIQGVQSANPAWRSYDKALDFVTGSGSSLLNGSMKSPSAPASYNPFGSSSVDW